VQTLCLGYAHKATHGNTVHGHVLILLLAQSTRVPYRLHILKSLPVTLSTASPLPYAAAVARVAINEA
jgi:hypothetical protein